MLNHRTILRIVTVIGILIILLFAQVLDPDRSEITLQVFSSLLTVGVVFLTAAFVVRRPGKNLDDESERKEQ